MDLTRNAQTLLTPEEERDLARAVEAGVIARHFLDDPPAFPLGTPEELAAVVAAGDRARERFLTANVGLVVHLVRRDARGSREREDLVQEGFLGLVEALETFDWARGTRFSTWAVPYVRGRIATARRLERGGIRIPVRQLRAAAARGEQAISVASIHGLEDQESCWWQDSVGAGTDPGPGPEDLAATLPLLTPEERGVLEHRFGLGGHPALSRRATAQALGLPLARVRNTEEWAIEHLRDAYAST